MFFKSKNSLKVHFNYLRMYLVPFEYFKTSDKTNKSNGCQYHGLHVNIYQTDVFVEDTSNGIGQYGQWQVTDNGNTPIREVMITEENAGQNHHGWYNGIDKSVAYF